MDIFDIYRSPYLPYVRISAPMVRYSKLPFRLLVREYNVDLAYTPMIMVDSFVRSGSARDIEFTTCAEDRPLIVQMASNSAEEFAIATQMLAPFCDGVDLNCGCPQKWAVESGLGSGMLRRPERIIELVRAARVASPRWRSIDLDDAPAIRAAIAFADTKARSLPDSQLNQRMGVLALNDDNDDDEGEREQQQQQLAWQLAGVSSEEEKEGKDAGGKGGVNLSLQRWRRHVKDTGKRPFSVSAKIRLCDRPAIRACGDTEDSGNTLRRTIELVERLAVAGADWVGLHCRTPSQRSSQPADWSALAAVVAGSVRHTATGGRLPIVLNGDVNSADDAKRAHALTGCHGVMAARGLLTDPWLFDPLHAGLLAAFGSKRMPAHTEPAAQSTTTGLATATTIASIDPQPLLPSAGAVLACEDLARLRAGLSRWLWLAVRQPGGTCLATVHQQTYWLMEPRLDATRRRLLHAASSSLAGLVDWLDEFWRELELAGRIAPQTALGWCE